MKPRLVFIDDDERELEDLEQIVGEEYDYTGIPWPLSRPVREVVKEPPSIFVLDLYFPPGNMPPSEIPVERQREQALAARRIGERFSGLYDLSLNGKQLLRETFSCIQKAYALLWEQCQQLKQSPSNGRALLEELRADRLYKKVPIVFYSRKVTVPEALRALQAGAVAVIVKPDSPPDLQARELVLGQLRMAQTVYARGWKTRVARLLDLNVNVTLFSQEFTGTKYEVTGVKVSP
jgi:DNA-binding NarL/FixJ family response regulator